ncbi:amino acid ABC transporter permease [Pseudomonas putida]|uniref:amino acid ABC transporter permease n=1 Tax=Pseudomonas putida TaxID=303 RepID=UPI003906CD3A
MSALSPAPRSMGYAVAASVTAVLLLLFVGTLGGTVHRSITTETLSRFSTTVLIFGYLLSTIGLVVSLRALVNSIKAKKLSATGEILKARAEAATSRQFSFITFGLIFAVAIVFALIQLLLMNNGSLQSTFLDLEPMRESFKDILIAFGVNIKLALISQAFVLAFGLVLAVARMIPGPAGAPIRFLAVGYIDLMRAVPAIIVLYLIGFGLPLTNLPLVSGLSPEWFAIIALSLTYSAYVAEIYRSGISSIHPSQWSASRSLGFSYLQTLRYFILPQAIRLVIPPLLSTFIALQKDTSLVNVIGTLDAFNQAKFYASSSFNLSSVTVVAILFIAITIPQTRYVDWILAKDAKRIRG